MSLISYTSSVFSKLGLNTQIAQASRNYGISAAFYAGSYKKRDGQLKFYSNRGYESMFVYAAKRTLMQLAFAKINDLYPSYVRQLETKAAQAAYLQNQGSQMTTIIQNGIAADNTSDQKSNASVKYKGRTANEGLLLWIDTGGEPKEIKFTTYWDKIKGLSNEEAKGVKMINGVAITNDGQTVDMMSNTTIKIAGEPVFLDLSAIVQSSSSNNLVLTKVQGRDSSRKELISGGDMNFTVTGKIVSNYPDVYPYAEVSKFITLMQHKGTLNVSNIMFQQFNVTKIVIKDFQMGQNEGFKNVQPYSFNCVGIEPDDAVAVVTDTINATNLQIATTKKKGWTTALLDQVKAAAANEAAQMVESLTAQFI